MFSQIPLGTISRKLPFTQMDLKPENILVSSHNSVKIADFGQACLYYPNEDKEYEENTRNFLELRIRPI
ncbi:hypothetical protein ANCCEY_04307 [Ancylostoma ceylanicum]|uniref:Protein kinase domain-containing protein n=1 Tax=Ancylostoma ceylanicum TaxID=53326 RepID=A0A0D6LZG3_9BILA|nr:hypothetical protein ANCCEY_04307 [Ancylostoma ceylanicum]